MAVDDPDVTETRDDTAPEPSESAAAPEQQPKDEPPLQNPEPTGEWRSKASSAGTEISRRA
ncbi:hypothetical protein DIPPA_24403 [Diplonema papillatum]|nr:hypothetical protein DIPPA_24403 [Diplonema papillatum]